MSYKKLFPDFYTPDTILHTVGGWRHDTLGPDIDLLVWNIYKGRNRMWHDDFVRLIADKDLVMLQESILNSQYDPTFLSPGSFEWVMAKTHRNKTSLVETGVKTGAAAKSLTQVFLQSPDVEPFLKTPKMLLATTYPIAGSDKTLLVVNVHAINFVSYKKYARQLVQIVAAIESHVGPVILAGDFNTWNALRYKNLLDVVEKMGLTQVELIRKGRWQHMNKHLDHIFYRGLELQSAEVLFTILSSDHYPLRAKFTIRDL